MKNLLLSIIACVISFFATSFALQKFVQPKLFFNTEVQTAITPTPTEETVSSSETPAETENTEEITYTANVDADNLVKDYKNWYDYNQENVELSNEFIAVDNDNNEIEKEDFLNKLKTGLYIPLKVEADDITYKLYELGTSSTDKKIGKSIRGTASMAYSYFKKEGTSLPKFDWEDLDGNRYTSLNTRGKIKVIKCWFINCVVCVQEFPELNELYDRYEGNENVQFISLAFDNSNKLRNFLTKKEFRYPVVPEQKEYVSKKLEIKQYPAHLLVDEDNNIIKMVNNVDALITTLDQLVGNEEFKTGDEQELETQE